MGKARGENYKPVARVKVVEGGIGVTNPDSLANSEHPDPVIPDPEPDWLLDSDEEFAIALEIESSG